MKHEIEIPKEEYVYNQPGENGRALPNHAATAKKFYKEVKEFESKLESQKNAHDAAFKRQLSVHDRVLDQANVNAIRVNRAENLLRRISERSVIAWFFPSLSREIESTLEAGQVAMHHHRERFAQQYNTTTRGS